MIHLALDPELPRINNATRWRATSTDRAQLRHGNQMVPYRLNTVVTHGDGTWTLWLVRLAKTGRDHTRARPKYLRHDEVHRQLPWLWNEIAAALDLAELAQLKASN